MRSTKPYRATDRPYGTTAAIQSTLATIPLQRGGETWRKLQTTSWEATPQTEYGTDRQNARHFDDKRKREPPRRTNANPTDNRYAAPIIGRGRSSKILAAKKSTSTTKGTTENRQMGLFVTRLATKTRAADVAAHVSLETGLTVKCEPIKTKYDGYRSFYVKLSPHDQHMLLNANLWPKGVLESLSRVTKITTPSQTGYALLTFNTSTDNNCLKIVTFNCRGLKSAMHDIRNMCMKYDIIFLQETWLSKNDNALLKDVDDNFDAFGISAMNDENGYQTGRPYGGLAVLWRKVFTHACTLLKSRRCPLTRCYF